MRCIRTDEFLYIWNLEPERWPAGHPSTWGDIDGSPTKHYMVEHRMEPEVAPLFERAFGRRPEDELYLITDGYACDENLAERVEYRDTLHSLKGRLQTVLTEQGDPRMIGGGERFDTYRYFGGMVDERGNLAFTGTDSMRRSGLLH